MELPGNIIGGGECPSPKSSVEDPQVAMAAEVHDIIEEIVRLAAERILRQALEAEVEEHLKRFEGPRDEEGHHAAVKICHTPRRTVYPKSGRWTSSGDG